jgi:hypothetical protein
MATFYPYTITTHRPNFFTGQPAELAQAWRVGHPASANHCTKNEFDESPPAHAKQPLPSISALVLRYPFIALAIERLGTAPSVFSLP